MNKYSIEDIGIIERIKKFIDYKGITVNKFETSSGIARGYLARLKGSVGSDKLNGILVAFPELSIDWLLTGQGPMLKTPPTSSQHIQNRDGNIVAGGSVIVPSHYAAQKIAEKKEGKLLEAKVELSELKQENERLRTEVDRLNVALGKSNEGAEALHGEIEALKKENAELHKQLIEEKERLISILMEQKGVTKK